MTGLVKWLHSSHMDVPTVWLDVETTGLDPSKDGVVQLGVSRFESGKCVSTLCELVNPGVPMSADAEKIHGISAASVEDAPPVSELMRRADVQQLLTDAQPGAYNAPFDRGFIPPFGDWTWPWLDCLSVVRAVDRYVKGPGRHKLETSCVRHGVALSAAHNAGSDAQAAGELFYAIVGKLDFRGIGKGLGNLLRWQRVQDAEDWYRFMVWFEQQPERT